MQLDPGEYFAIERGRCIRPEMETPVGPMPAEYDHTFDGCIFKLIIQEYTMMAVEVVFPHTGAGQTYSIDTRDMELMRVSPQYVKALQAGDQFKEQPPSPPRPITDLMGIFNAMGSGKQDNSP